MDKKSEGSSAPKFAILLILLAAASFLLVFFNIVSCGFYSPLGCEIYYSLIAGGKPKVLIVHGEDGLGDPQYLYEVLRSPRIGARVSIKDIGIVSVPDLINYQLVIVERARTMSSAQLRMIQDYVNRGGRLVWIGDAGSQAPPEQADSNYFLVKGERKAGAGAEFSGPWARKSAGKQLSFDHLLGVQYRANYCELAGCKAGELAGVLDIVKQDSRIVNGISQSLPVFGDFSIVEIDEDAYQTALAYTDYGTNLLATAPSNYFWLRQGNLNFGREFPAIVSSGLGGRVVYYSFPPEFFVSDKMPVDKATGQRMEYWAMIENLYYGMLYKG